MLISLILISRLCWWIETWKEHHSPFHADDCAVLSMVSGWSVANASRIVQVAEEGSKEIPVMLHEYQSCLGNNPRSYFRSKDSSWLAAALCLQERCLHALICSLKLFQCTLKVQWCVLPFSPSTRVTVSWAMLVSATEPALRLYNCLSVISAYWFDAHSSTFSMYFCLVSVPLHNI